MTATLNDVAASLKIDASNAFITTASFEDPESFAASQLVMVLSIANGRADVLTRKGNRYSLDLRAVNLHAHREEAAAMMAA